MPLNITGPVSFINGRATTPSAQQLIDAGFDPLSGQGYGQFVQQFNAQEAVGLSQSQSQGQAQQPVDRPVPQMQPTPQTNLNNEAQQAANINLVLPVLPPPAMQSGKIQSALGVPPTVELANKYRYNPRW